MDSHSAFCAFCATPPLATPHKTFLCLPCIIVFTQTSFFMCDFCWILSLYSSFWYTTNCKEASEERENNKTACNLRVESEKESAERGNRNWNGKWDDVKDRVFDFFTEILKKTDKLNYYFLCCEAHGAQFFYRP